MVGLQCNANDVAVIASTVFLHIHTSQELDTIEVNKAIDATGGGCLWRVVLRVNISSAVEQRTNEAATHL